MNSQVNYKYNILNSHQTLLNFYINIIDYIELNNLSKEFLNNVNENVIDLIKKYILLICLHIFYI
jgi:hypothetical protein